jgi:nitrite reductase/ring-hydroxylating ferredoxin subunit
MNIKSLVDPEGGLIDRRIFADREIYELERERLFARCWLYLGHESEIPNPGDFVTAYMGEEPVILWRDLKGQPCAYLNLCRHRGNRVCRADRGNAKLFTCSYHGWTYSSDGKLAIIPRADAFPDLDREKWGLIPVAQLDGYKGLIFATFDADAPPLLEYLGDMAWYLDILLDRAVPLQSHWRFRTGRYGQLDPGHRRGAQRHRPALPGELSDELERTAYRDRFARSIGEPLERLQPAEPLCSLGKNARGQGLERNNERERWLASCVNRSKISCISKLNFWMTADCASGWVCSPRTRATACPYVTIRWRDPIT